jgi:lipopolysaccharide export LptBFGC system permease protein LptF
MRSLAKRRISAAVVLFLMVPLGFLIFPNHKRTVFPICMIVLFTCYLVFSGIGEEADQEDEGQQPGES